MSFAASLRSFHSMKFNNLSQREFNKLKTHFTGMEREMYLVGKLFLITDLVRPTSPASLIRL